MALSTRQQAWDLFTTHNDDSFHVRHALTVEGVMRYFAHNLGYAENADFWAMVGLLHDLDFGRYPEEHCTKSAEILAEHGASEELIHAVVSHGYGHCSTVEPVHEMEKVLFAVDELTGLIWATALMRPSKSVQDLELSSVKKKFKDKKFAAGCSRDVIREGAHMLGWELDDLISRTILAMRSCEDVVG